MGRSAEPPAGQMRNREACSLQQSQAVAVGGWSEGPYEDSLNPKHLSCLLVTGPAVPSSHFSPEQSVTLALLPTSRPFKLICGCVRQGGRETDFSRV